MATKAIPEIEPWHRNLWSEKEAIAMLNLKGQPDEWARVKKYADILPGGNYKGDQLLRIADSLLVTDNKEKRKHNGIRI